MFTAALFTITKLWKKPQCPTTDEQIRNGSIYTQWSITQPQGIMTWNLKLNGCNWRISRLVKLTRTRNTKVACFFSWWTIDPKINIYTKTSMIIYKHDHIHEM
jgi:hypothetical protein